MATINTHVSTADVITESTGIMSGTVLAPVINVATAKVAMGISPLFVQTADVILTNTVTETSIVGSGVGSKTLVAGFFNAPGKVLRVRLAGIYSTPAIVSSSVTIKIKIGTTVIATGTTTAIATGATNLRFIGDAIITCRTSGVSGVLSIDSAIVYNVTGSDIPVSDPLNNAGATITAIDLTGSLLFDITAAWDSATTTRIAQSTSCVIEGLN